MEQRIKDKKENFIHACNLLEQILNSIQQQPQNDTTETEIQKSIHLNELKASSEFLENKLSLHFSLDVTNKLK